MTSKYFARMLLLACAMLFLVLPQASARGRGGAVFVRPAFGWGWDGGWYDPFWGPYPYAYDGFGYAYPSTGTVKFDTNNKDTGVYIAGGYAGTVGELKSLHLRPGTYNIELRAANSTPYAVKVFVTAGKTVHIKPNQAAPSQP